MADCHICEDYSFKYLFIQTFIIQTFIIHAFHDK